MIFEAIRSIFFPFDKIDHLVPKNASILDMGCGHGILSRLLAAKSPRRKVLGIDPSLRKITIAAKNNLLPNLSFRRAYLHQIRGIKFDTICIVDVLYLLPPQRKLEVFRKAKHLLKRNGQLLICEVDKSSSLIFKLINLQEKIMIHLLGLTHSDFKRMYFLEKMEYTNLLKRVGFRVCSKDIGRFLAYPHFCLIAR